MGAVARQRRSYRSRILWFGFCGEKNSEKVLINKQLGEDEKEKRLFLKEAKILRLKVSIKLSLKLCECNRVQ